MRKILIAFAFCPLLFAFCFFNSASAELKVDIIAGNTEPIPIAIQKFEVPAKIAKDAEVMRSVVENDLKSSGLFRIISHDAHPEFVRFDTMPKFQDWAMVRTQVLIQTKIDLAADGKYKLSFYVWDIAGKEQIEAQTLVSSKKSMRRLAHIMADAIYERLTGESGYFDTQIVFIAESGPLNARTKRMAIMDSDGFGFRYISDANTMVMSPHFSPNMQTVLFLSYRNDDPMIWSLDMNTGEQRRLGKFSGMTFSPRFSPDGTKVALSMAKDGATNIYEYDLTEKKLRQLTFDDGINTSPAYSPDGTMMAFNSNQSGTQQLHIIDLGTLNTERLSYGNGRYATPAFSQDGNFIAFTKIADDTFYIGIMNQKGRHEKILASGWFMEAPSWAPGSRRVVYYDTEKVKDDDAARVSRIRTVDISGMNDYEIKLPDGVNGTEPTWSPKLP
ncbi:MAG: Tol-Pal system beta propeller repeat protein TolB [Rickettsiales bacterium]|jgi:TolB protein|nr:Tol-Pal system beta propeller repeat protein TolB [Rickettsiales bacterium]